jgi:hypothetical protein
MERLNAPVVTEVVPAADVLRGRAGAESIVVAAFDEHAGRLKAFALRAVRDADVADDEAITWIQDLPPTRFRPASSPRHWKRWRPGACMRGRGSPA